MVTYSLLIAVIAFLAGIFASSTIKTFAAAVNKQVKTAVSNMLFVQVVKAYGLKITIKAYVMVFTAYAAVRVKELACTAAVRMGAGAGAAFTRLTTAAAAAVYTFVELVSYDLPETSFYSLSVETSSAVYPAGEYLVMDNGQWRNVFLTSHARTLMGDASHVIALNSATVLDGRGTSAVWHTSLVMA